MFLLTQMLAFSHAGFFGRLERQVQERSFTVWLLHIAVRHCCEFYHSTNN